MILRLTLKFLTETRLNFFWLSLTVFLSMISNFWTSVMPPIVSLVIDQVFLKPLKVRLSVFKVPIQFISRDQWKSFKTRCHSYTCLYPLYLLQSAGALQKPWMHTTISLPVSELQVCATKKSGLFHHLKTAPILYYKLISYSLKERVLTEKMQIFTS